MEVTGELRLIVAVTVDAGTKINKEGERFVTGATNAGDVVGADIMQSKITLGSLLSSQLMTRFPPSTHRLYKRLFKCWCCSPEIVNVSLLPFWGPRMPYWSIPIFVFLGKHISTSSIQSQHFFIFFAFC